MRKPSFIACSLPLLSFIAAVSAENFLKALNLLLESLYHHHRKNVKTIKILFLYNEETVKALNFFLVDGRARDYQKICNIILLKDFLLYKKR